MRGPGKYDPQCTVARESTGARLVCLIVIGGDQGEGFSVQCDDPPLLKSFPTILRSIAASIEKEGEV